MKFEVITRVPTDDEQLEHGGNLAMPWGAIYQRVDNFVRVQVDPAVVMLGLQMPVFYLGEVLIVDEGGRELVGHQRKSSKWDVTVETFDTIEAAVARAQEVQNAEASNRMANPE